jgi:hypothetical protein
MTLVHHHHHEVFYRDEWVLASRFLRLNTFLGAKYIQATFYFGVFQLIDACFVYGP